MIAGAATVFRKEIVDALRDRRTLMMVFFSSIVMGPLVMLLLSNLVAGEERRAQERVVLVAGIEHAPTLANYLERQTVRIRKAPPDYEAQLRASRLGRPVIVIGAGFEGELARGETPRLRIVSSSADQRADSERGHVAALLRGFGQEQAMLRLAMRGVAPALVDVLQVDEVDLADAATRSAQLTGLLPFFVLMAVVYGALNAALDTTAGERERGSLEPLLMTPRSRAALVVGKWGAVTAMGMLIAVLSAFSFVPAQWLIRSETLAAMFRYGPAEAAQFIALLAPLAAALAALLMAVAVRSKSFKEAQASTALVVLGFSLLPLVNVLQQEGESPWQFWVPALAQSTLMRHVLEGQAITLAQGLPSLAGCALITVLALRQIARVLVRSALS